MANDLIDTSQSNNGKKSIPFVDTVLDQGKKQVTIDTNFIESIKIKKPEEKQPSSNLFQPDLRKRKFKSLLFHCLLALSAMSGVLLLCVLLMEVFFKGFHYLDWQFMTSFPSRFPHKAGIMAALSGSLWVISLTALFSIPVGVGAAIFLQEYSKKSKLASFIEINIANLAGVPSIIYGLLGLVVFVRVLMFGRSILSGALTMSLLILPVIIVASREALKSVPMSIREASYALGATQWQTVWAHVLPAASPGILTGIILAISRAVGETAPLIMIGAVAYMAFLPEGPMDAFTVLPIQVFDWTSRPQESFHELAATAIIVLLLFLLSMNAVAVLLRNYYQNKNRW